MHCPEVLQSSFLYFIPTTIPCGGLNGEQTVIQYGSLLTGHLNLVSPSPSLVNFQSTWPTCINYNILWISPCPFNASFRVLFYCLEDYVCPRAINLGCMRVVLWKQLTFIQGDTKKQVDPREIDGIYYCNFVRTSFENSMGPLQRRFLSALIPQAGDSTCMIFFPWWWDEIAKRSGSGSALIETEEL